MDFVGLGEVTLNVNASRRVEKEESFKGEDDNKGDPKMNLSFSSFDGVEDKGGMVISLFSGKGTRENAGGGEG